MRKIQLGIKRFFDIVSSLVLIICLTVIPILLIIAIAIKATSKGPVVFKQERVGKDGKLFNIYKFRTMLIPKESFDKDGEPLGNYERITKVGAFLRKTSLDELLQLFNVLNGTMSVVGPRPTLKYQVDKYTNEQRRRLEMRPGITGWAQVNGRNDLSWTEKIKFDIEYIDKFSLFMDIKILFMTVGIVFGKRGIDFTKNDEISAENKPKTDEKKALVLCGGIPQVALIDELKRRGVYTILADMNDKCVAVSYADKFYPVSVLDVNAVMDLAKKENVNFVITVCADQVLQVMAEVSEKLNLPCYIDLKTAENVSKKSYMKKIFQNNGIPTSKFIVNETLDFDAIKDFQYPLIVKPEDSYSSRGVRKVGNPEEAKKAFEDAIKISRTKTAIIEEFVDGKEISVDVYVEEGKAYVLSASNLEKIKSQDRFVIYRTIYPARTSKEIYQKIEFVSQQIADAFNLKNSPMLIQLIDKGDEISVIEFCARTGGGDKFRLIKNASGFDVIKAAVDLAMGEKPHVEKTISNKIIVDEFLYCYPGVFDKIQGFEEMVNSGSISEYYLLKQKGSIMKEVTCSGDRVAYFTIEAEDMEEICDKYNHINATIKVLDENGKDILRHDLIDTYKKNFGVENK